MSRNVEVKAHLRDRAAAVATLEALGAQDAGCETQVDRFWRAPKARLKLRRSSRDGASLLVYRREDAAALRASDYERLPVAEPEALARMLDVALDPAGTVRKERHLWFVGGIRVHLDRVEGLGDFVEIEAVVDAPDAEASCADRAARLCERLGVRSADVVAVAYVDLLASG